MASRLVVLRQRLAKTILSALDSFSGFVAPEIGERTGSFLQEGEVLFDFSLLQRVLSRMIETSFEQMVAADKAHFDELTSHIAPRMERDNLVEAVRQKLIETRRIAQGLFGLERAVEIVAIEGDTGRQPELLWRQAEHTLSRLRSPDLRLPTASTASVVIDSQTLADELEPLVTRLEAAIKAVERQSRSAITSLQTKQDAMTDHDQLIVASSRIISGFYLLARRPDLAKRIRLALRPKRQTPSDDTLTDDTQSPPPDAEPDTIPGVEPSTVP